MLCFSEQIYDLCAVFLEADLRPVLCFSKQIYDLCCVSRSKFDLRKICVSRSRFLPDRVNKCQIFPIREKLLLTESYCKQSICSFQGDTPHHTHTHTYTCTTHTHLHQTTNHTHTHTHTHAHTQLCRPSSEEIEC